MQLAPRRLLSARVDATPLVRAQVEFEHRVAGAGRIGAAEYEHGFVVGRRDGGGRRG